MSTTLGKRKGRPGGSSVARKFAKRGSVRIERTEGHMAYSPLVLLDQPSGEWQWEPSLVCPKLNVNFFQHQASLIDFMQKPDVRGAVVWWGVGSGKTKLAIGVASALKMPTLVVATKSTIPQWREAIRESGGDLNQFRFYTEDTFMTKGIRHCSSEYLLVVDEAQRFRKSSGVKTQAIQRCSSKAGKILLLTGTPIMNGPYDLASLINMVTTQTRLPPTKEEWEAKFGVDGLKDPVRLHQELRCKFSYYLRGDDNPNFPTIRYHVVSQYMSPQHQKLYDAVEEANVTELARLQKLAPSQVSVLESKNLKAFLNGVRRVSNRVEVEGGGVLQPKIDTLVESALAQHRLGKRQLIYSGFNESGLFPVHETLLTRARAAKLPIRLGVITGSTSSSERQRLQDLYNSRELDVLLFGQAGGVGMDLKHTDCVQVLEHSWMEADMEQAIGRAARHGSHPPNSVVDVYFYEMARNPELYPRGDKRRDILSADQYIRQLAKKKDAINKAFTAHILQDSIENNPGCSNQDSLPAPSSSVPALLRKLVTAVNPFRTAAKPVLPTPTVQLPGNLPCASDTVTLQALQAVAQQYGLQVPANVWTKPLPDICSSLAKLWPPACFQTGWKPKELLSMGKHGAVYLLCAGTACNRVAKVQLLTQPGQPPVMLQASPNHSIRSVPLSTVEREYKLLQQLAPDLAPTFHGARTCSLPAMPGQPGQQAAIIEMEHYRGSLGAYWAKYKDKLQTETGLRTAGRELLGRLGVMIDELHRRGVIHNDLHLGNILYKPTQDGQLKLVFTDFGEAVSQQDLGWQQTNPDVDYHRLVDSLKERFGLAEGDSMKALKRR